MMKKSEIDAMSNSELLKNFISNMETWATSMNAGNYYQPYEKTSLQLSKEVVSRGLMTQTDMDYLLDYGG